MAGLVIPSIQTVTTKVQLSQSSVLGNTFLEDTQVCHGVSDLNLFHYITGHSSSSCKGHVTRVNISCNLQRNDDE